MFILLLTSFIGCDSALVKTSEVEDVEPNIESDEEEEQELEEDDQEDEDEDTGQTPVDQTPDSVSALIEEVEDDCSNGDENACALLDDLTEQLEDCAEGDEEACDEVFGDLLEFYTEPQNDWIADNYLADFEMSRIISSNNYQQVCSSMFLVEIDSNGELVGTGSCQMQSPSGAEINFVIEGSTSENESNGLVTITSTNSNQVIETTMVGTCENGSEGFGFTLEWEHTFTSGQQIPFYSVVTH